MLTAKDVARSVFFVIYNKLQVFIGNFGKSFPEMYVCCFVRHFEGFSEEPI